MSLRIFGKEADIWRNLGEKDPMWAILSDPNRKHNLWDAQEFFSTGQEEIKTLMSTHGVSYVGKEKCLDFGCGIGRLTAPLADFFQEVHGVDVSAPMIKQAQTLHQQKTHVFFHHNLKPDLSIFPDNHFDFIYSHIVLQHIPPPYNLYYVKEFMRILKPGGRAVFQIPAKEKNLFHATARCLPRNFKFFMKKILVKNVLTALQKKARYPALSPYQAEILLLSEPKFIESGNKVSLQLSVKNTSREPWIAQKDVVFNLGSRWFRFDGKFLEDSSPRMFIGEKIGVREKINLNLDVIIPSVTEDLILLIDLVHENRTWFKDANNNSFLLFNVLFREGKRELVMRNEDLPQIKNIDPQEELFSVNAIRCSVVKKSIKRGQGNLIKVIEDHSVGVGWESYMYVCEKKI